MNFETVHYLNLFLGAGAILTQILSLIALGLLFFGPKKNTYLDFIDKHFLELSFVISFSAVAFSLVYSEIVGFLPCYLCWFQRAFLIPIAFITGMAAWVKDRKIIKYTLPMLLVGFVISVYQNLMYYFAVDASNLPCDASGVSCYKQYISEFGGYISIPMLALTAFFALITIILVAHFYKKVD